MHKTVLFDLAHPAHFHLFRNFIFYLKSKDHKVVIASREKDVLNRLLESYELDFYNVSSSNNSIPGYVFELLTRTLRLFKLNRKYHFDYSFGTTITIGFLTLFKGVPSFSFNEDDDIIGPIYVYLTYPFTTNIMNPVCLRYDKWKDKRILYNSYHELAYLHPNNFTPEKNVLKKYGLDEKKYIIMRFSALAAHHDIGARGLNSEFVNRIKSILIDYKTIQLNEKELNYSIDPVDIHHLLYYSKMIISDSQTMTAEAAVLGIPAIRFNTYKTDHGYLAELETRYKLIKNFRAGAEEDLILTVQAWLNSKNLEDEWKEKRRNLLKEKIDFNQWMIDFFETGLLCAE